MAERSSLEHRAVAPPQRRRRHQAADGEAPRRSTGADPQLTNERVGQELRAFAVALEAGGDERAGAELREVADRLLARFVLAVVGEFSSGKSYLLNALLGKRGLLKTDINPSTATITELEYSPDEHAIALYADGREERVPLDHLSRFVAVGGELGQIHDATRDERDVPTYVRVRVDSPFLRGGFIVADTPGLASVNPAHRRATLAYLQQADAVLYLIDTQTPFTEGDASFLGIVRGAIETVFIVQTKIDLWRMPEGDAQAWESAYRRIRTQAELHAPGTRIFPLSARDYSEGIQAADEAQVERSRFRPFLETLDASLLATTGRTRLRRAAVKTRMVARAVLERFDALERAFALDSRELDQRRTAAAAALATACNAVAAQAQALDADARGVDEQILALGDQMRGELLRSIASALDVADIARLRDRAKLHVLVDGVTANVAGTFAQSFAGKLAAQLDRWAERADVTAVEIAASAFGASPAAGAWQGELEPALRATVVLGAIGGPAVAFVHAIATRFAAAQTGTYMKRELIADLRATLFPALDADVATFVDGLRASAARAFARLSEALTGGGVRVETAALEAVERVAALRATGGEAAARADLAARTSAVAARLTALDALFDEPAADAGALSRADEAAIRLAEHVDRPAFDPEAYERGLRPTRWRVAVLGAIKRGKSSLINAVAGERILADEGGSEELGFPVHVRYGEERAAFALDGAGEWREILFDEASRAARSSPILIEIPWRMPRELVLVHAPAFDSGDPYAEEIALAVAQASSETLCLFSRQLSERELTLYVEVARSNKPMLFAHTIADNEAPAERRSVVELAHRYLAERAIVPLRLFTVSTLEYRDALANGRAPAAWNELGALVSTLEAHAEEHMAQLARRAAGRDQVAKLASTPAPPGKAARPPLRQALDRIFRRR